MSQDSYHTLVVDDEPQVRELTCRALGRLNFLCDKAADGAEALLMLAARKYDLMVTDLRMPVTHGHTLCAAVLAKPQPPQVVVLTGIADGRLVKDLLSRGVADVIHKPVPYDVLATKIQAIFERDRWRDTKSGKSHDQRLEEIESQVLALGPLFAERLETAFSTIHQVPEPPSAITDFIKRLEFNESQGLETATPEALQRRAQRVACNTLVNIVPVNRKFEPTGEPARVCMRDISASGMRIIHSRAISSEYLALNWNAARLPRERLQIFGRVVRCEPLSRFYEIGVQFVLAE
jgi:CheY-like chemotaxis protein